MRQNYSAAFRWMQAHEGGYVNHPDDPGGATNRGVIQRVYDAFRRANGVATRSVREITDEEVQQIYRNQYWNPVRGDDLPSGVDYAVFDFAVNSGVSRAVTYLQRVVGVEDDGHLGEITLDAVRSKRPEDVILALCNARMRFLKRLRHWPTFGRGWTRRVMGRHDGVQTDDEGVIDRAIMLARAVPASQIVAPRVEDDGANAKGTGPVRLTEAVRTQETGGFAGGVLGALGGAVGAVAALDGTAQIVAVVGCLILAGGVLWFGRKYIAARLEGDA
jgi:lysozyme family protein